MSNVRVLQGTAQVPSGVVVAVDQLQVMAGAIARSGLFGMKTPDQALALMLIAQAEGRHPAEAARDYDVIQGRPSKKAEAMLRDFLMAGGKVEWHKLDDTTADATFAHPQGGSVRISWDLERAKKAGLGGKDNWHKFPRQMLRSRTVSEGVRTVWPMATSGMYVPEEVREFETKEKDMGAAEVVGTTLPPAKVGDVVAIDPSLEESFRNAIAAATTEAELADIDRDAMEACKAIGDRAAAKRIRKIVKDRRAAIGPETGEVGPVTFAIVADMINKAQDYDALNLAADLIRNVSDPEHQAELASLYKVAMARVTADVPY